MSKEPVSPQDYLSDVLAKFEEARVASQFGEALVWAGTAAILDSDSDRIDPASKVNTALFQLVFDIAVAAETLVIRCGNATANHGEMLATGQEATDILVHRLGDNAPEGARSVARVIQGHFKNLFEKLGHHLDGKITYVATTGEEATLLRNTTATMRKLIAGGEGIKADTKLDLTKRAALLDIAVTSPDYEVIGNILFRWLSLWDKALFHIESAQSLLAEIKADSTFTSRVAGTNAEHVASALEAALKTAHTLTTSKSNQAKQSYKSMAKLGHSLVTAFSR